MQRACAVVWCWWLAALVPAQGEAELQQRGFRRLWNGVDLQGWHGQRHHDPYQLAAMADNRRTALRAADDASVLAHWRIENGELINDGEGAFLTSDAEFGDAEFLLEYRTVPLADSGIYLRGSPQVQIWDWTEAGGKWPLGADKGSGGLWNNERYERFPPRVADRPFGEWNTLRILQVGSLVYVWLNGEPTVDGVIMENFWNRQLPLPRRGRLQLQTHGGEIRFRNLWVRELDAAAADAVLWQRDAAGYEPLFDGATLAGWRGDRDSYEVHEGTIRCRQGRSGHLFTDRVFADFSLRLQFLVPPGGNNGLAIRYPGEGEPAATGIELQVLDDEAPQYANLKPWQYHGSVYGVLGASRGYLRPAGQWNTQEVTVRGSHFRVLLNGAPILDADIQALASQLPSHPGKDRRDGHIGFCGHQDPVAFRRIEIRPLPATAGR